MAGTADKTRMDKLVGIWANIFKSIPSEQLEDLKAVEDLWNEAGGQFANPSRSEIKTGSPQASSGGGAQRMVDEYSDPAPQMGMAQKYAEFSSMLRDFQKAHETTQAQVIALHQMLTKSLAPAATDPATAAKADDSVLGKAEMKLKKARAELRKADMADAEDKEEREEAKSFLEQAGIALKAAKRFLVKAEDDDGDDDERAEKARADLKTLTKALRKAEDEDKKRDDDDAEKARVTAEATAKAAEDAAAKAAAAAAPAVKAEDDDKKDDAEKARAAAEATAKADAAAAPELAPVDPGLRGQIEVLQTNLKGLMDVVMAGSKGRPMPTFMKSATAVATLGQTVDDAIESGALESPLEILKAQTLVTHIRAVQAGHMDAAIVDDEIARAPDNVRQLFATQAAA